MACEDKVDYNERKVVVRRMTQVVMIVNMLVNSLNIIVNILWL